MGFHLIEGGAWDTNTGLLSMKERHPLRTLAMGAGVVALLAVGWIALQPAVAPSLPASEERASAIHYPVQRSAEAVAAEMLRTMPQASVHGTAAIAPRPLVSEEQIIASLTGAPPSVIATAQAPEAIAPLTVANTTIAETPAQPAPTTVLSAPAAIASTKPTLAKAQSATQVKAESPAVKVQPKKEVQAPKLAPIVKPAAAQATPAAKPATAPIRTQPVQISTRPVTVVAVPKPPKAPPKAVEKTNARAPSDDPCQRSNITNARGVTPISVSGLRQIANGVATFHGGCRLTAGSRLGSRIVTEIDATTLTIKTTEGPINFYDDGA